MILDTKSLGFSSWSVLHEDRRFYRINSKIIVDILRVLHDHTDPCHWFFFPGLVFSRGWSKTSPARSVGSASATPSTTATNGWWAVAAPPMARRVFSPLKDRVSVGGCPMSPWPVCLPFGCPDNAKNVRIFDQRNIGTIFLIFLRD